MTIAAKPVVRFEVPTPWCNHPIAGEMHRHLVATITIALSGIDATVELVEAPWGVDFSLRAKPNNGILLSYHSIGMQDDVWRIMVTPIPYYFSFDRFGYSGWSEIATCKEKPEMVKNFDLAQARAMIETIRTEFFAKNVSKYPQPSEIVLPSGPFVFFPLQLLHDTVAQLSNLDMFEVLDEAARLAVVHSCRLLVKRHPFCRESKVRDYLEALTRRNSWVHVLNCSVHEAISKCKAVICCNSGVGFEALVHGKPVFVFGRSEYAAAAEQLCRLEDVSDAFLLNRAHDPDQRDRFLGYYLSECCFDVRNVNATRSKIVHALSCRTSSDLHDFLETDASASVRERQIEANKLASQENDQFLRKLLSEKMTDNARLEAQLSQLMTENEALTGHSAGPD